MKNRKTFGRLKTLLFFHLLADRKNTQTKKDHRVVKTKGGTVLEKNGVGAVGGKNNEEKNRGELLWDGSPIILSLFWVCVCECFVSIRIFTPLFHTLSLFSTYPSTPLYEPNTIFVSKQRLQQKHLEFYRCEGVLPKKRRVSLYGA